MCKCSSSPILGSRALFFQLENNKWWMVFSILPDENVLTFLQCETMQPSTRPVAPVLLSKVLSFDEMLFGQITCEEKVSNSSRFVIGWWTCTIILFKSNRKGKYSVIKDLRLYTLYTVQLPSSTFLASQTFTKEGNRQLKNFLRRNRIFLGLRFFELARSTCQTYALFQRNFIYLWIRYFIVYNA